MTAPRKPFTIPNDWFPGTVPENVVVAESAYVETSRSFLRFRSERPEALVVGPGAALYHPTLDVGPGGRVDIGAFALLSSAAIFCDLEVTIGARAMFAWNVVVMDSYRGWRGAAPLDGSAARTNDAVADVTAQARPVRIGDNVWLGFESCVLPGVTIGEGSVVGARAVVNADVPPYCIVAGNPARVVRELPRPPNS